MNEIVTLKRKVVSLGKLGFWMTAVTILISLLSQVAGQVSLWTGELPDWLLSCCFEPLTGGFTSEELNQSDQRAKKILGAVHFSEFFFQIGVHPHHPACVSSDVARASYLAANSQFGDDIGYTLLPRDNGYRGFSNSCG
jgi:hypothetical protein